MSRSPLDVVCDAGPLIHLDEVGCLDLLTDFHAILVPEQVWREVEHHRPDALAPPGAKIQRIPTTLSDDASFQALVRALALDLGEQAALSLMALHPGAILLTDDAERLAWRPRAWATESTGASASCCEQSVASSVQPRRRYPSSGSCRHGLLSTSVQTY
jgi:hypothetical protein